MKNEPLSLLVMTYDESLFDGEVDAFYVNTPKGEVGVLENHVNYLANVVPGQLRVIDNKQEQHLIEISSKGILEVRDNQAKIILFGDGA